MRINWSTKKLGEVANLMTGGTPSKTRPEYFGGDIRWLVSGDIHQKEIFDCEGRITEEGLKNSNARFLPRDSVLIALNGQGKTRGTVAMLRVEATCNQSLVAIIPDVQVLDPKFLFHNLTWKYLEIRHLTGMDKRQGLNMKIIRDIEIPLPPLTEQKKIVAKLEKMLAKIKEAKRLCAEARAATQSLFSAELHKIFEEGKKKGWEEKMIDEIAGTVQYGYTASAREKGSARLLRITDIQNGGVSWESVPFCECEDLGKYKLYDGDIVFARTGATVGKSYLINNPPENAIFASYLIRVGTDRKQCSPELLYYFFQSMDYWDQITEHAVGGAQPNVNGSKLKKVKIFLPSLVEQEKIVTRLDKLSAKLKKLEEHQKSTALDLARLEQAILQKAFSRDNLL